VEPGVLLENQKKIREQVDQLLKDYSGYWFGIDHITVVEEATQKWGLENIPKIAPGNQQLVADMQNTLPRQNPDSPDCKIGAGGGFSISYLDHPVLVLNILNCPLGRQIPAAHEFTHAVQTWMIKKAVSGDANPGCFGPSWLREGQAQVASMTLSYWDGKNQSVSAFKDILLAMDDPNSKTNYLKYLEDDDPSFQEYDIGAMASLYLVGKYGWQKSLDVWTASAKLSVRCDDAFRMTSFATAFQQVYGFSLDSFYLEVTPYLQFLYDNRMDLSYWIDAEPQPEGTVRIQLNEGCHASSASAVLQFQSGDHWTDLADHLSWVTASCKNMYLPWTFAKVTDGMVLRWHVFAPGAWDWYSTPYTYKS
jgi:hypothetical protein